MNELPSKQFRTSFHRLTEPTTVTALGRPIGTWTPVTHHPFSEIRRPETPKRRERIDAIKADMVEAEALAAKDDEIRRLKRELAARPLPPIRSTGTGITRKAETVNLPGPPRMDMSTAQDDLKNYQVRDSGDER
jgi:hypothetical protein